MISINAAQSSGKQEIEVNRIPKPVVTGGLSINHNRTDFLFRSKTVTGTKHLRYQRFPISNVFVTNLGKLENELDWFLRS